ncbi:MAG: M43 family zinc metalloprotease, partial [Saprospiraceae bacterium]
MLALNLSERAQMFTPHYTGPYDTVQGKFFVRLYLVYCQDSTDSWADSLGATELHRRTARTFAMLNSAFNKHDIYFVPGEANSGECHLVHTKAPNTSCPKFAQGITMHVLSDDNEGFPYARGYTYDSDLLSTSFYVQGREGNDPGSNLAVTIHEIGHCFGLAHTFANTNAGEHNGPSPSCAAPNGCQSGYGNDPDQCCGDLVGDTPKHSNSSHIKISSDCDLSETPSGVSPVIFKNYMSYSYPSRCLDQFSDQQVRRMRMYLKNSPALDTIKVPATTIPTDTTIWSTPTSKFSNIEVPSGSTLIVNDVLEMAPGTYIVVRRGGTLIVNGTVTAGCGGMWGGIVVEGAANQPQKNSNGLPSTAQGRFVLNTTGIVE